MVIIGRKIKTETGWNSCFLQDVIHPFFERGTLLIKYSISGEARGRTETKTKLTRSLDRSRFGEDASSDFSAHETRNIAKLSADLRLEFRLKGPVGGKRT
jgi:hypothetical protein